MYPRPKVVFGFVISRSVNNCRKILNLPTI
jgi:hypothetical protein